MLLEIEGLLKCTEFESGDEAEAVVLTSEAPLTLQETLSNTCRTYLASWTLGVPQGDLCLCL